MQGIPLVAGSRFRGGLRPWNLPACPERYHEVPSLCRRYPQVPSTESAQELLVGAPKPQLLLVEPADLKASWRMPGTKHFFLAEAGHVSTS